MTDSLFCSWRNEERYHGRMAASSRIGNDGRRDRKIDGSFAVAHRAGGPGIAGADAAGLSRESFVLCGGAKSCGSPSNGSALRGAGAGLRAAGGNRGSATAGQRTGHYAGGQSLVGVAGVRQGQGARLSARTVDDAAFGTSRPRARTDGG